MYLSFDAQNTDNCHILDLPGPPLFPMTPPASPFTPKTADKKNQLLTSTAPAEPQTKPESTAKVSDSKSVACDLVNEAWKDITATKSA